MFSGLFEFLAEAVGVLLDLAVKWFMGALDLSLADMIASFPFLTTAYNVFQAVGMGLTIVIASVALYKFFFVGSTEGSAQDRPLTVIVWTAIAVLMSYYGGYILEEMVKIARIPYNIFLNADAVDLGGNLFQGIGAGFAAFATVELTDTVTGFSRLMAVLQFFILVAIAWELLKLMLEVCERYMMVGILVYTAPIAYCTLASSATRPIFHKWFSMFFSSLLLMSLSVFFLKLAISGFSYLGTFF